MTTRRTDFVGDLSPRRREADRARVAAQRAPWDVLVVGGGVTGVGVALDAASRGLSVLLVEAHDLAFGTSRWSSKLVHGGLRYLASGRVGIAWESAVERNHLMTTIAPHLVSPLTQAIPIRRSVPGGPSGVRGRLDAATSSAMVHSGLVLGDLLRRGARTPREVLAPPRRIHADDLRRLCPAVSADGLVGAWTSQDGQLVDDARLVVAIARTAAAHGATIVTRMRAEQVTGRGARLVDTTTGDTVDVAARAVVNATGVWADTVDASIAVRPSRGAHLVVDAARLGNPTAALTVPVAGSRSRFVFAIPAQLGRVHIGLTDTDAPGPVPDVPQATDDDVDFILDTLNVALAQPLSRNDVIGTFAGLRPLLESDGETADVSREHSVSRNDDGVITVVGGKLTTYRRMASDALDAAIAHSGLDAHPCVTASIPLIGAQGTRNRRLPASLLARHGGEADRVVAMSTVGAPLAPIAPGVDVTRAEIEFAVIAEGAVDADDILHRRTRIGLVDADTARARPAVVHILDQIGAAHSA
ncbi:glycerol-3-phosphate dehydrogenase/oxidase [Williamsia deligens]|uniref:Glycerol-3-phosphate dehydrogenase n=1 Tax=Williamsia deligens TaxID=321325 RepID=A0ABW3G9M3_9NOCA|nr:glycerol-3-phosphate dehydrogenase/oxidase [Williamsia deligens]MCP2193795.1 glycerol-3-phosphate dehydrogenase [Williamsia deligens]